MRFFLSVDLGLVQLKGRDLQIMANLGKLHDLGGT